MLRGFVKYCIIVIAFVFYGCIAGKYISYETINKHNCIKDKFDKKKSNNGGINY